LIPREFGRDAVEIPGGRELWADLDGVGVPWAGQYGFCNLPINLHIEQAHERRSDSHAKTAAQRLSHLKSS
jgi:hypothetical protein